MNEIFLCTMSNKSFYLTGITEQEKEDLLIANTTKTLKNFTIKNSEMIATNVVRLGSKEEAKPSGLSRYVSYLKGYSPSLINKEKRIQYRDYTRSEEKQLVNAHLVAVCSDPSSSARTAIMTITKPYLILWYKEN